MNLDDFQSLQDNHKIKHDFDAPFAPHIVDGLKMLISKEPDLSIEAQTENLLVHNLPPNDPAWSNDELRFMLDNYWQWFPNHGWIIGTG